MTVRARVRGIYTTALTRLLLDAGHEVVQASRPVRERFDVDLAGGDHDVAVATTRDRQGVEVTGEGDAVDAVEEGCESLARDALTWAADAPAGAVFNGRVTETLGSGAVVDLGPTSGFLPYDAAAGYVDDGDTVVVQVTDPRPPWSDSRSELAGEVTATAGLATLVRGSSGVRVDTRDGGAGRELAGMTDLLDADVPDGWGVRWAGAATDADMATLGDALDRAAARAAELETALAAGGDADGPGLVAAPRATTWCWFGRESRFALDDARERVTTTMPGHHRIKAAHEAASAGVDLVEALCEPSGEFPFDVVADQFGPHEGGSVTIGHGKPDGRLVVLGRGEVVDRDGDGTVEVRREMTGGGRYDALGTRRAAGDTAHTTFREGRWWYPTVYRNDEGDHKGTYVNVCTPVECFPDVVRYVDLHVDVVKHPDGTVERVDDDELDEAVVAGDVSEALAEKARTVAASIEKAL
jgi:hypothetical protein